MKTSAILCALPVMCALALSATAAEMSKSVPKGWSEDYEAAKTAAEKGRKLILLAFSGSDWCGWCMKMEKDIYSDKKFINKAKRKFVLVMIDKPRDESILSPLAKKQNKGLLSQFNVGGFPSTVIVRPSGEEVRRFSGYQRDGVDAFLAALDEVASSAGVKGSVEISAEEAKKDDRFFPGEADKAKIASRESKQRKENAKSDLALDEFHEIKFFTKKTDGKPVLKNPYGRLSEVRKVQYTGNMLTGLVLAAPHADVKAMSEEELCVETCRLVRALEEELGVRFAVTPSKIDFKGLKTQVVVRSSKAASELSVQISVKK